MMELNRQILRLVSGMAVLSLSLMACQGSPSGGSLPAGSSGMSAPQSQAAILPMHEEKGEINSTCGKHIHIIVAGIVRCRFWERSYGDTTPFTIDDHTNGIVTINPKSGGSDTKFTIVGAVVGNGYFIVRDNKGHTVKITVVVSL